jgi:hypothetical protein
MFLLTRGGVSRIEMLALEKQNAHKNGILLFQNTYLFPNDILISIRGKV